MVEQNQQTLDTLQDIKRMMERSSRFISLSGLSGIAAGICALAGAWFANKEFGPYYRSYDYRGDFSGGDFQLETTYNKYADTACYGWLVYSRHVSI